MVYMGGHVSHHNPAVTFDVLVRGKIETREAVTYANNHPVKTGGRDGRVVDGRYADGGVGQRA